jgi:hypothetical protein
MKLQKINNTSASYPFLRDSVVRAYYRLRNIVKYETGGMDILADVQLSKPKNFVDSNVNIGYRSRLKCGDAFTLDRVTQLDGTPNFIVTREQSGRFFYYRVWILLDDQSGTYGQKLFLTDILSDEDYDAYVVDFTELAEYCDWRRVAWTGRDNFTQILEYQFTEGLSYEEAMLYLYSKSPYLRTVRDARKPQHQRVLGLNDRGSAVRNIQEKVRQLGYIGYADINGVFDKPLQNVIQCIQEKYGLDDDGLVGEHTRELLYTLTARNK